MSESELDARRSLSYRKKTTHVLKSFSPLTGLLGFLVESLALTWGIKSYKAAQTANDLANLSNEQAYLANQIALVSLCQGDYGVRGPGDSLLS